MVRCVTCGKSFHWKETQAGHFVHGTSSLSWLDERNVHVQCIRCNKFLHGHLTRYAEFMINTYGGSIIRELLTLHGVARKWKVGERKEISDHYKRQVQQLQEKHDYLPPECRPFSKEDNEEHAS